jgi:serine/threonine-protein kinase
MDSGRVIAGRYRLLDRLGAGGMSVVWRAHDEVLDREVAVKVLSPELAADSELLHRIHIEARAAARLHHPNVVEVHDYGETEQSLPYVVMELVDGRSLADLLTGGPLNWRLAVLVCAQVAAALSAAHSHGIVHRDVKPSNVMVTSEGVKLVDFGISATVGEADGTGDQLVGTPAYLAPERLSGGSVRPATDVYALGLLLYLALCGRLPWKASTTTQMLKAHRYLEPAVLPPVPELPAEVAALCHACLAKEPDDRPPASEAARVLAGAAGIAPPMPLLPVAGAPVPAPTTSVIQRPTRRRHTMAGAAAAAVTLLIGGAFWWGGRSDQPAVQAMAEPAPSPQCTVRYAIRSALNGRFSTAVTVVNTGTVAAGNWRLSFNLPDGQTLVRGSGWRQDGQSLQLSGTNLASGASTSSAFDATYREATTLPAQFRLNDTVCLAELSVAGQTVPGQTVAPAGPAGKPPAHAATGGGRGATLAGDKSGKGGGGNSGKGKGKGKEKDNSGKGKGGKG